MDPRFKMKLVEFSFTKIYGDDSHEFVKIVDDGFMNYLTSMWLFPLPLAPAYAEDGNMKSNGSHGGTILSENGLTYFDAYIMETSKPSSSFLGKPSSSYFPTSFLQASNNTYYIQVNSQ